MFLPLALCALQAVTPPATPAQVREAYPQLFDVVSAETPSGRYVGILVPKQPAPGLLAPIITEHGYLVTYLLHHAIGFAEASVLDPGQDTARLHHRFADALQADSTFNRAFLTLAGPLLGARPAMPKPLVPAERALAIAARFFYPDSILPTGQVRSRICVDPRGVRTLPGPADPLVEGFVFQAIRTHLEGGSPDLMSSYEALLREGLAPGSVPIDTLRQRTWQRLEQSPLLRSALKTSYAAHAQSLPFRLGD